MKYEIELLLTPEQSEKVSQLHDQFIDLCNDILPYVHQNQCWNRVALHHLVYHSMRQKYPKLGSQLVCNSINLVCKFTNFVYQKKKKIYKINGMPHIIISKKNPVILDARTISIKNGIISIITLEGRMKVRLSLRDDQLKAISDRPISEAYLQVTHNQCKLILGLNQPFLKEFDQYYTIFGGDLLRVNENQYLFEKTCQNA